MAVRSEGDQQRALQALLLPGRVLTAPQAHAAVALALRLNAAEQVEQHLLSQLEGAAPEAAGVRLALARLLRKTDQPERAREQLSLVLDEQPGHRRARTVLNALLEREERWEQLDASLELQMKAAAANQHWLHASRASLRRARIWSEQVRHHSRAALRYRQAAEYAAQSGDFEGAFSLRLLWLKALHQSNAPTPALQEAIDVALDAGDAVGKTARVRSLARELKLHLDANDQLSSPDVPWVEDESDVLPRSHSTQIELLALADELASAGRAHAPEVTAVLAAAAHEGPDTQAEQRLEAHLVARGAWRELAAHYRARADAATARLERVEALEKLAELLESELDDAMGAAKVYAELMGIGDARAMTERVRLLSSSQGPQAARSALDEGVTLALTPLARAAALVQRGEHLFATGDFEAARVDAAEALRQVPAHPQASVLMAELAAEEADLSWASRLPALLHTLPPRHAARAALHRRLARLAEGPMRDEVLAKRAWAVVLHEAPHDEEATARMAELSRHGGDTKSLELSLRAQLKAEPRGTRARHAWRELVSVLEKTGRDELAVEELLAAVRLEPGHQEAWVMLVERFTTRSQWAKVAWALEHAAASTEAAAERSTLWLRLAHVYRDQLHDDGKAQACEARAAKLQGQRVSAAPLETPQRSSQLLTAPPARKRGGVTDEPTVQTEPPAFDAEVLEVGTQDLEPTSAEWQTALGEPAPPHSRRASRRAENQGTAEVVLPDEPVSQPSVALEAERVELFERVRDNPLQPEGYRLLAEHFDTANDPERSSLMLELALALEGDPNAAPRAPKLILSTADRANLKHSLLRKEEGELLNLAGTAMCRLFPSRVNVRDEFRLDAGKGARAIADALLAAVRILGLRAPDVYLAEQEGPPFALVHAIRPKLLVGRLATKKELPEAELRFFAGRALFTMNPDLLALRSLKKEQLEHGLQVLAQALKGGISVDARLMRDALPPRSLSRLKELSGRHLQSLPLSKLVDAARHSVNRAGLVVAGGVAPALTSLKAKRALPAEMLELVRFAASERYLKLRTRTLS